MSDFPIRCFTCGKVIGRYYIRYEKEVLKGEHPKKVLDDLNVKKTCCRTAFLSYVNIADNLNIDSMPECYMNLE